MRGYIEDIYIYSDNEEEELKLVHLCFDRHKLTVEFCGLVMLTK